jgi:hypothetical protein
MNQPLQQTQPPTLDQERGWQIRVALVILAFVLFASILAFKSQGVYHDDDLTHFQIARWAWHDPRFLLDIWGRPGCTLAYAPVAGIGSDQTGFMLCRYLTILFAAASAVLTAMCAKRLGLRRPELAAACLLFMPLYFHLSYTTLTEIVCGLYLIGGTWLLLINRPNLAAIVLGLAPLARQESVALLAILGLLFLYKRQWLAFLLLFWGLVAWQGLSMAFMNDTPFGSYTRPKPTDIYGSGGPLHYMAMWGEAIGTTAVGLCMAGSVVLLVQLWNQTRTETAPSRRPEIPYAVIIPLFALALVALHTIIFMRGLFAGGGYARFLLAGCPWMALCVAVCLEHLWFYKNHPQPQNAILRSAPLWIIAGVLLVNLGIRLEPYQTGHSPRWHWLFLIAGVLLFIAWPRRITAALILALAAIDVTASLSFYARPHHLAQTQHVTRQGIDVALAAAQAQGHPITGISPWVKYFCAQTNSPQAAPSIDSDAPEDAWRNGPAGMLFVYDSSLTPHRISLDELSQTGEILATFNLNHAAHAPDPYIVVLQKRHANLSPNPKPNE